MRLRVFVSTLVLLAGALPLASCKDFHAKAGDAGASVGPDGGVIGIGVGTGGRDSLDAASSGGSGGNIGPGNGGTGGGSNSSSIDASSDGSCGSPTDPRNCGTCGHDCTGLMNVGASAAGVECRAGVCFVPPAACAPGFAHCTAQADDGCETNLLDSQNCGACGIQCPVAAPLCATKGTVVACASNCAAPTGDMCLSSCVDLKSDPRNCGTCGHDCSALANVKAGATGITCQAGVCSVPPAACATGFAHCSARADDGCEASLTDSKTCGSCATACATTAPVCSSAAGGSPKCTLNCTGTTADICGTSCVNLKTDPKNCGTCTNDCTTLLHVKAGGPGVTCQAGICNVPPSACATGFAHCSTNPADGCEADLSRPTSCGQCGKTCVAPTGLCSTNTNPASCSSSCTTPTPNLCSNKCVNTQTDPLNCGVCNHSCAALPNVKAGAAGVECRSGACFIPASACVSGFAHCPGAMPDAGCETSLTSTSNCGLCGKTCTAPTGLCSTTNAGPACTSSCVAPAPDLCSGKCVDVKSDPLNCGTCNDSCSALLHVRAGAPVQCVAGVCQIPPSSCAAGFGHCTGSGNLGCETALNACGGCGALVGTVGAKCGACGTNACSSTKTSLTCSDPGLNACGGCGTLIGTAGAVCGKCGKNVCSADKTALTCSDPGLNLCGGCGALVGSPGAACGTCGKYACSGTTALSCVGVSGTATCSNNAPQSCNSAGQLVTGAACSGATPVCSGGTCAQCANGDPPKACPCGTQTCTNGKLNPCVISCPGACVGGACCAAPKAPQCSSTMCCTPPAAGSNLVISCAAGTSCQTQCATNFHACNGTVTPCYSDTDIKHCSGACLDCTQANAVAACGAANATQCANSCAVAGTELGCKAGSIKPSCGSWGFETGTEGWALSHHFSTSDATTGSINANNAQHSSGAQALAIGCDMTSGNQYCDIRLTLCPSKEGIDLSTKSLSLRIFTAPTTGGDLLQGTEFFVWTFDAAGNAITGGGFLDPPNTNGALPARTWTTLSLASAGIGTGVSAIEIQFRVFGPGAPWAGTVYYDSIQIK